MVRTNQVVADNHKGWEVQDKLPNTEWRSAVEQQVGYEADGDTPIYEPIIHATFKEAEEFMAAIKDLHGKQSGMEYRVYEVLGTKK